MGGLDPLPRASRAGGLRGASGGCCETFFSGKAVGSCAAACLAPITPTPFVPRPVTTGRGPYSSSSSRSAPLRVCRIGFGRPTAFGWLWRLVLGCGLALAMVLGSEFLPAAAPTPLPESTDALSAATLPAATLHAATVPNSAAATAGTESKETETPVAGPIGTSSLPLPRRDRHPAMRPRPTCDRASPRPRKNLPPRGKSRPRRAMMPRRPATIFPPQSRTFGRAQTAAADRKTVCRSESAFAYPLPFCRPGGRAGPRRIGWPKGASRGRCGMAMRSGVISCWPSFGAAKSARKRAI